MTDDSGTGRQTGRVVLNVTERIAGLRGGAVITVSTGDVTIRGGGLVVR